MPWFASDDDKFVMGRLEAWKESANELVQLIASWSGPPGDFYAGRDGEKEKNDLFGLTSVIVAHIHARFGSIDPTPIEDLYIMVALWLDHAPLDDLPARAAVERGFTRALLRIESVGAVIMARSVREDPKKPTPAVRPLWPVRPFDPHCIQPAAKDPDVSAAIRRVFLDWDADAPNWKQVEERLLLNKTPETVRMMELEDIRNVFNAIASSSNVPVTTAAASVQRFGKGTSEINSDPTPARPWNEWAEALGDDDYRTTQKKLRDHVIPDVRTDGKKARKVKLERAGMPREFLDRINRYLANGRS